MNSERRPSFWVPEGRQQFLGTQTKGVETMAAAKKTEKKSTKAAAGKKPAKKAK